MNNLKNTIKNKLIEDKINIILNEIGDIKKRIDDNRFLLDIHLGLEKNMICEVDTGYYKQINGKYRIIIGFKIKRGYSPSISFSKVSSILFYLNLHHRPKLEMNTKVFGRQYPGTEQFDYAITQEVAI